MAAGQTLTLRGNHVAGAHINYLIEGLDLVGTLVQSNNTSGPPRLSDWQAAKDGCDEGGTPITWGALTRSRTINRDANDANENKGNWTKRQAHPLANRGSSPCLRGEITVDICE